FKAFKAGFHGGKRVDSPGVGVIPVKGGFGVVALAGDNRVVGVVGTETDMGIAHSAADGNELRGAQIETGVGIADLVSHTKFGEPVESVAHINAGVFLVEPIQRDRIIYLEELEPGVAGADVRRKEPLAERVKRPIEFTGYAVGIAESEVGSPFGSVTGDIQESQTPGLREGHVLALGAVGLKAGLKSGGCVPLFVDENNQPGLAVFFREPIIDGIKLTDSGQLVEHILHRGQINRLTFQWV